MFEWRPTLTSFSLALLGAAPVAAKPHAPRRVIIYLHGAIVETGGVKARDPRFGPYDWAGIVRALGQSGASVQADVRPAGADVSVWANRIADDIRRRIATGTSPSSITVIGASKGAVIASLVSTRLRIAGVRYVLMGNCNDWLLKTYSPRLTGEVLSIFEASDTIGGTCQEIASRSPTLRKFSEIRLSTGLGHGFLYWPLPQWIRPALDWSRR